MRHMCWNIPGSVFSVLAIFILLLPKNTNALDRISQLNPARSFLRYNSVIQLSASDEDNLKMHVEKLEPQTAGAPYTVTPLFTDLLANAPDRETTITIHNNKNHRIAIAIHILQLDIKEDGEDTIKEDNESFAVFPKQRDIAPNDDLKLHVQWRKGTPATSESFYVEVDQVPEDRRGEFAAVENLYQYRTILNVVPASGNSSLQVEGVAIGLDSNKKRCPILIVRDNGNIFAKLSDDTVVLESDGWSTTLSSQDLKRLIGLGLVQPGHRRKFLIPIDLPASIGSITARVIAPH